MKYTKHMFLMLFVVLLSLQVGCMAQEKSENIWGVWPEDQQPEKIGRRLVENYLDRDYYRVISNTMKIDLLFCR